MVCRLLLVKGEGHSGPATDALNALLEYWWPCGASSVRIETDFDSETASRLFAFTFLHRLLNGCVRVCVMATYFAQINKGSVLEYINIDPLANRCVSSGKAAIHFQFELVWSLPLFIFRFRRVSVLYPVATNIKCLIIAEKINKYIRKCLRSCLMVHCLLKHVARVCVAGLRLPCSHVGGPRLIRAPAFRNPTKKGRNSNLISCSFTLNTYNHVCVCERNWKSGAWVYA